MLQLIAKRHATAHIIAFVAGPCALGQRDVPGLASRLQGTRVDIVMLASAAEVGSSTMQALQSLVDCLNSGTTASSEPCSSHFLPANISPSVASSDTQLNSGSADGMQPPSDAIETCSQAADAHTIASAASGGLEAAESVEERASRLLFVQPPQESMEVWEQMEPLMEMLEGAGAAPSRRPSSVLGESAPSADAEAPLPGSSPNPERLPASDSNQLGTSLASSRPNPTANAAHAWQQQQV